MIAITGTVGVPACYGGFETLIENLLNEKGEPLLVYCSSKAYKQRSATYKNARLVYVPLEANGISSILYDIICALDAVRRGAKTILILGVSGTIIVPVLRNFTRIHIVTNIDGLEYHREKWGAVARWFLRKSEAWAVKYSHSVIADNQAIVDHVQRVYGRTADLIAYGGDHALLQTASPKGKGYALGLCRIEPENNVHLILEAFTATSMPLKFVGNWNNSDYGKQLKKKYGNHPNIELEDPIYQPDRLFSLRNDCSLYVHGHSAGGTNPSLVEMMHFGRPIACFDCSYNRYSTDQRAYFFRRTEELRKIVENLNTDTTDPSGLALQSIARTKYTWNVVRQAYLELLGPKHKEQI